jgi:hypothetical protein
LFAANGRGLRSGVRPVHLSGVVEPAPAQRRTLLLGLAVALLVVGAYLRFAALDRLELFVDEGGHLLAPVDADVRRVIDPVREGKPAMAWFFALAAALPADPLWTARALVAACGLVTAIAIGTVLLVTSNATAALLGLGFWLLLPFAVFHERLALFDPVIATLIACGLAAIALGSRPGVPAARAHGWLLAGGLVAGSACLAKLSALAAAPGLVICYWGLQRHWARPVWDRRLAMVAGGYVLPVIGLFVLAPQTGQRLAAMDGAAVAGGVGRFPAWVAGYGGWPLGLLAAAALVALLRRHGRLSWYFGGAWVLSLVIAMGLYPVPYARYVHGDHVVLVIFLAGAIASLSVRQAGAIAAVALGGWLRIDWQITRDPRTAPLPADEKVQYVTGLWSGDGSRAALAEIRRLGRQQPSVVFVHRYSRPASYAAVLAARREPTLNLVPLSLEAPRAVDGARAVAAKARALLGPTVQFYVLAEGAPPPEGLALAAAGVGSRVVWEHVKPDGASRLQLLACEF